MRMRLSIGTTIVAMGCGMDVRSDAAEGNSGVTVIDPSLGDASSEASDGSEDDGSPSDGDEGIKLDVSANSDGMDPCAEGGCDPDECAVPSHVPCDEGTSDLLQAIGLNCPDELVIEGGVMGAPQASGVRTGFGPTATWAPREGGKIAVIGSGVVAELDTETPQGDQGLSPTHCNDDLGIQWDPGIALPPPLQPVDVTGDCAQSPMLVGSGDCSNSIEKQYTQGQSANDYTELRIDTTVPSGSKSFSYDLAFFSVEYPYYYFSEFNDMYVGWLESEKWTGNVSFDEYGNPISLNASFLDFMDDDGSAPELQGTCMRTHAGTKWLTTTAPVDPGEDVTIVFAIFDLSDSILDSFVLLDNFQWGCEGGDHPSTTPVG